MSSQESKTAKKELRIFFGKSSPLEKFVCGYLFFIGFTAGNICGRVAYEKISEFFN